MDLAGHSRTVDFGKIRDLASGPGPADRIEVVIDTDAQKSGESTRPSSNPCWSQTFWGWADCFSPWPSCEKQNHMAKCVSILLLFSLWHLIGCQLCACRSYSSLPDRQGCERPPNSEPFPPSGSNSSLENSSHHADPFLFLAGDNQTIWAI